jgi:lipopolysaccharide/colanic/teichoic acid biosynthesis glycosyltransferase
LTGLWQVRGRNTSTFDDRLRLDVEYLARRSLLFDLRLILETVASVVNRSGA